MRVAGPAARALALLETDVARAVSGRGPSVLAFSGGLGSLLVASLARKRCDLRCTVVGFRGSADVGAAEVARKILDYPVSVLQPSTGPVFRAAQRISREFPRLGPSEVEDLVPLVLVREKHPRATVVSGFGLTARSGAMWAALTECRLLSPGMRMGLPGPPRAGLVRLADAVGLPESFSRAAPHTPREGSGVGPAIRALARSHHTSVARLIAENRAGTPRSRSPRHVIPKSLDVDYQL